MSDRITRKTLDGGVRALNRYAGIPETATVYTRVERPCAHGSEHSVDVENRATAGMFYVDGAYGGWSLHRVCSDGHGVSDVFRVGHVSARELYGLIWAMVEGLRMAEDHDYERRARATRRETRELLRAAKRSAVA